MVNIDFNVREKNFWVYLTIFLVYCFFGAIGEHLSYFFSKKKKLLLNPIIEGFPLYGIGAYLAIWLHRSILYKFHPVIEIIIYGVIISAIEYAVGSVFRAGPNSYNGHGEILWWDYTGTFLNINGIVNFRHFIMYGIGAFLVTRIHPLLVERANRLFD